jgi:hypothetical protein
MLYLKLITMAIAMMAMMNPPVKEHREALKCYGYTPCNACSNCSECKYCNAGGTCGVCAKPKTQRQNKLFSPPATSAQCKATKKGTRCSRRATNAGYCWQHAK